MIKKLLPPQQKKEFCNILGYETSLWTTTDVCKQDISVQAYYSIRFNCEGTVECPYCRAPWEFIDFEERDKQLENSSPTLQAFSVSLPEHYSNELLKVLDSKYSNNAQIYAEAKKTFSGDIFPPNIVQLYGREYIDSEISRMAKETFENFLQNLIKNNFMETLFKIEEYLGSHPECSKDNALSRHCVVQLIHDRASFEVPVKFSDKYRNHFELAYKQELYSKLEI